MRAIFIRSMKKSAHSGGKAYKFRVFEKYREPRVAVCFK